MLFPVKAEQTGEHGSEREREMMEEEEPAQIQLEGHGEPGAYPMEHRARGGVHPGQGANPSQGTTRQKTLPSLDCGSFNEAVTDDVSAHEWIGGSLLIVVLFGVDGGLGQAAQVHVAWLALRDLRVKQQRTVSLSMSRK
ncbi:hypothetical protein AMELA_G00044270 [Ameiurus melas]|uniref:Uncharacterized protein n=1 Tax=Ameiurus melas TaxID=219545 RepID=A0A7J6B4A8_AMEME|nr:hypothetical protein AMELA_G00044270 [Ameiurus melas]